MSASMLDPAQPPVIPLAPEVVEALVQTDSTETRYRRAGHGASVVFLGRSEDSAAGAHSLFRSLAARFRVIAPEPHPALAHQPAMGDGSEATLSFSTWLRGVIDGLGLVRPALVADEGFGIAALSFALTDPERVGRLVVVSHDAADAATPDTALGDVLSQSGHPLLLLRTGAPATELALAEQLSAELLRFLADGAGPDGRGS
jgi:pimeloyl-ACP methyl ester carboxylesterase